jgi:serine phosphatase RsbU (regulator of sigma subunit)/tetratricopeptide (TPR) repeat protein
VYGNVLSDLGTYYKRIGESEKAVLSLNHSLKLREKLGDQDDIDEAIMNLGRVLHDLKDFATAKDFYDRSLQSSRQRDNKKGISVILNNRGQLFFDQADFLNAKKDFEESLVIRREIDDKKGESIVLRKLGDVYLEDLNPKKALDLYKKSALIAISLKSKISLASAIYGQAMAFEKLDDFEKSYSLGDSALAIVRDLKIAKTLLKVASFMQPKFKLKGDLNKALLAAEDVQWAQNQIKEEEAKDLLLKQEYQSKEASANRSVYLAIGGALVLLVIAILLFRAYRLKRKAQHMAEQQKELVEERNKNMVDSIQYAQQLQSAILPSPQLFEKNFSDHFLIYLPKDIVAGDFYWFYENDQYRLWAVADCTGHGVPGAMVSVVCSNALNRAVKEYNLFDPGEILTKTRELVVATFQESQREVKDGMDIALCCLEKQSGQITFSGANRPCWVVAEDGVLHEVKGQKQHIGLQQNMMAFESVSIQNKSGWIVLTSDGMADQFGGPQGKKWMTKTLKQKVSEMAQQPGHLQKMNLEWAFQQWRGAADQIDDVCVLGIKI